ncbi:TetR/AcrR family transcriptional regulator [Prauserella endophytica]|uniref:TetR/AcrR family transcriptional regulator n=1 Tax=Prauserella endophytica TaxID=1592324 RepID=A0ABY2SA87_9PSEU|nr:TetR/AcrR family transcriptional regulator [Prauserella endophytica]TKG72799.1 TetR/AcrR family transcriptional regulator [Prauserella endophytica]
MTQPERRSPADDERTPLSRRAVAGAAVALADAEGLDAVTIRRLAKDLGVTPMALYWHFRNKDELLDGIVELLYDEIDLPGVEASAPWPRQLSTLLESIVTVLRAHPATAPLLATRNVTSESSLRTIETALDILGRGGFSPAEATQIVRHALSTVTNLVSGVPGATGRLADPRHARTFLESLPAKTYPRLVEAAGPLTECEDKDAYFAFGLELLLSGIEATASKRTVH